MANCVFRASLISSSSRYFKVLNRVAWCKLGGVSASSIMIVLRIGLTFLVTDYPLVCERILVTKVVWRASGSVGESKICPSVVLGVSGGSWVLGCSPPWGGKGSAPEQLFHPVA